MPTYLSPEDAALLALPEHLRRSTFKKDQQMLSAQMLSGIPEVDLGIEAKIKNIERTEQAKRRLIEEGKSRQDSPSEFVPANMAANFVQHDRYKIETPTRIGRARKKEVRMKEVAVQQRQNTVNMDSREDDVILRNEVLQGKASDDYVMRKYKEQQQNRTRK